ncbi:hypothetical protein ACQF36_04325 [Streptomyces sp. Marseille-Q5077]|uniref:hypothetical protein n=1 Tax=Streptomyces sp. Marseille-Q5077 TaxID=3418995 RepID=UPI003D08FFE1
MMRAIGVSYGDFRSINALTSLVENEHGPSGAGGEIFQKGSLSGSGGAIDVDSAPLGCKFSQL